MKAELGIAEPGGNFLHLVAVVIVEVLPGAENLQQFHARLLNLLEQRDGEALVNEQVRRQRLLHKKQVPGARC